MRYKVVYNVHGLIRPVTDIVEAPNSSTSSIRAALNAMHRQSGIVINGKPAQVRDIIFTAGPIDAPEPHSDA